MEKAMKEWNDLMGEPVERSYNSLAMFSPSATNEPPVRLA
jgi:hypothetical protein